MRKPSIKTLIKLGKKRAKLKKVKKYIPRKASEVTSSKIEKIFEKELLDAGIKVKSQHQIGYKFYDFIIEDTNILVEFDGDYWHVNPEVYPTGPEDKIQRKNVLNDLYKDKLAKSNGYELIRVWEKEFKEHPRSVIKRIKTILKESEISR